MSFGAVVSWRRLAPPILMTAMVLAGCSAMIESTPVYSSLDTGAGPRPVGCHSSLGSYSLPKSLLRLTFDNAPRGYQVATITTVPVADRRSFCLSYLNAITSDDKAIVKKSANGLLEFVGTRAEDKTVEIAKVAIDTARIAAAGILSTRSGTNGERLPPKPEPIEFDPFDRQQYQRAMASLRRYGLCVVLEGVHVPESGQGMEAHCDARHPPQLMPAVDLAVNTPVTEGADHRGILYRPNLTHMVSVLRKADPGGREAWSLQRREAVEMPNAAPVLSISVERALLTRRDTIIDFQHGVLTNVSVKKDSELVGLADITLSAAQAIVAIPAQVITLRIDIANQTQQLIANNAALIEAQLAYKKALDDLNETRAQQAHSPAAATAQPVIPVRNTLAAEAMARFMQNCLDARVAEETCRETWREQSGR